MENATHPDFSFSCTHEINGDNPVAILAGAHVKNMDYKVHIHVDNVKFEFGFFLNRDNDSDKESEKKNCSFIFL